VLLRFQQEVLHGPADGGREQELARDAVVEFDGNVFLAALDGLEKVRRLPVPRELKEK
jgi:hypothetical protein